MNRLTLLLVVLVPAACGFAGAAQPRRALFATAGEISRARQRCDSLDWAKARKERILKIADAWTARSDQWIREILPPPGSKFSYGVAGCPKCSKAWKNFGADVADFDQPLKLKCPHCQTLFDLSKQEGDFADAGDGIVVNGQRHWVRGVWNGFVVDQMWSAFNADNAAIVNLADAYALTGDERYAHTAIIIMDALATLSPTTNGPRDFEADPAKDAGRLQHLTSIVFRAGVHFARALDLLGDHAELGRPSPTNPSKTIWDNIRDGIFEDYLFVPFDTRNGRLVNLHNHEADSVRALLLTGLIYGNADYIRWGAKSFQAFLDNVIDRDGLYYETSFGYTAFTRSVFVDMAEMLARYDPSKYPAGSVPTRDQLPFSANLFNHPGFARLVLDQPGRISMLGRAPTFGNNHFDGAAWKKPGRPFERIEMEQAMRFEMLATAPAIRNRARALVAELLPHFDSQKSAGWWSLYRSPDKAAKATTQPAPPPITAPERSDLFGQTGLVYLRSGKDENRRGAVIRVGMNMPHSHDDQLGLLLYASGRALSGDIGYGIFGNHVHLGWAGRAIAHNTVVVDQDQAGKEKLFRIGPGGSIRRFGQVPGVTWVEADLNAMYAAESGVKDFRRLLVQVDLSPSACYWIDLFDVAGGRVHDYSFHANPLGKGGSFQTTGADPKPIDGVWTLAGLDPKWKDASFDQPDRAWGQRVNVGGMVSKLPGVEDEVEVRRGWHPPPGNGYGFLYDVRTALVSSTWSATWNLHDRGERFGLRLTMLPQTPQKLITARGPNINGSERMNFIIARSGDPAGEPTQTRFAAVVEAFDDKPLIDSIEAIRAGERIVGMKIRTQGGIEDLLLDARQAAVKLAGVPALESGLCIIRRNNGKLVSVFLTDSAGVEIDGTMFTIEQPRIDAVVTRIDDEAVTFITDPPLPDTAAGSCIIARNNQYTHTSAYRVASVSQNGAVSPADAGLTLGRASVEAFENETLSSTAPLVFGYEYDQSTRFLDNKRLTAAGGTGQLVAAQGFAKFSTRNVFPRKDEPFVVHDLNVGDNIRLDSTACFTRQEDGTWKTDSNVRVKFQEK